MYVITLSSIPTRFASLGATLDRLVRQEPKPEAVLLYVPWRYRRFPDWDGTLPAVPKGVEIRRVEEDFGPATKLLPALTEFSGSQTDILYCDDDMNYRPGWAASLIAGRKRHPGACIALSGMPITSYDPGAVPNAFKPKVRLHWRATDPEFALRRAWVAWRARNPRYPLLSPGRRAYWKAGHADVFEGYGGVLVRPGFFHDAVFDIPDVARQVDDIWLSGMAMAKGTPIWVPALRREPDVLRAAHHDALHLSDIGGQDRTAHNRQAIAYLQKHFGVWV